MTKSTITREQLLEIIETDHVQCGEASALARMALAAMESEPYGFTEGERFGMVLEPRQWPAPKDGEPQLHIKNRLARYPRRVFMHQDIARLR